MRVQSLNLFDGTPDGERELAPGDGVCFRTRPEDAHQVPVDYWDGESVAG